MSEVLGTTNFSSPPRRLLKLLSVASWLAFTGSAFLYTFKRPSGDGDYRRIWEQNALHPTPFSLNPLITSVYWSVLLFLQIPYLLSFYSSDSDTAAFAAATGPYFVTSTLLSTLFVHLWVRSHLWLAFAVAILAFLNLSGAYARYTPRQPARAGSPPFRSWASGSGALPVDFRLVQHYAALAGPLAFGIVAVYWSGAAAFHVHGFLGRLLANVAIWGILLTGFSGLFTYGDWLFAVALAALCGSLGLTQMLIHVIALQWIFAFSIMSILLAGSFMVVIPTLVSRGELEVDSENRPLLRG